MTRKKILLSLFIIFLLSLAGISLWLYEILNVTAWNSLRWLYPGALNSPYACFLIACFAFLIPFVISKKISAKQFVFAILILYPACFICYKTGRDLNSMAFGRFYFITGAGIPLVLVGLLLFLLLAWVCWIITHRLIKPIPKKTFFWILLLLLASIPLSLITIQLNSGFGWRKTWIDAVKMGYPVFWMIFLIGISGIVLAKNNPKIIESK